MARDSARAAGHHDEPAYQLPRQPEAGGGVPMPGRPYVSLDLTGRQR
ncbi:hypothetical protein [Nonomuraea sediminis]|nr:hypothetical protein [Nonomuraea sediminis]